MESYSQDNILADIVFKQLLQNPSNNVCFECKEDAPKWASVNNAIFICMNCAGVHRGLGVDVSFVRSMTMDSWSEAQLKMMSIGGNARLAEVLDKFDLQAEPVATRYTTRAVEQHRAMLRCECEHVPFDEPALSYEEGRLQIEVGAARTPEQIMEGNGSFGSHNQEPENDIDQAFKFGAKLVKAGVGMVSKAAGRVKQKADEKGLTEKVNQARTSVKARADEKGISQALHNAQQGFSRRVHSALDSATDSGKAFYHSAKEGTLKEKTKEKAGKAGAMMAGMKVSLLNRVNSIRQKQQPEESKAEAKEPVAPLAEQELSAVEQPQSKFDGLDELKLMHQQMPAALEEVPNPGVTPDGK